MSMPSHPFFLLEQFDVMFPRAVQRLVGISKDIIRCAAIPSIPLRINGGELILTSPYTP